MSKALLALSVLTFVAGCSNAPTRPAVASTNQAGTSGNLVDSCAQATNNRLQPVGQPCRTYSKSEIDTTGQFNSAANALGLLDPSITVHH